MSSCVRKLRDFCVSLMTAKLRCLRNLLEISTKIDRYVVVAEEIKISYQDSTSRLYTPFFRNLLGNMNRMTYEIANKNDLIGNIFSSFLFIYYFYCFHIKICYYICIF